MKIFSFDDNNRISYTSDGVTEELDSKTIEDLKALKACSKDEEFIDKEIERNKNVAKDENASPMQKKVAEDTIESLEKNKTDLRKSMSTLVSKVKAGFNMSKTAFNSSKEIVEKANSGKKRIDVDSKDPVLELFCTLLNQDATRKIRGEKAKKGVAVPEKKEEKFVKDLAEVADKPAEQKLIELSGKGYELTTIEQGGALTQELGEDQALVIISKDRNGKETIITFDNAADALAKKDDPAFREEFFAAGKETFAYSVSKQEFLSNAMKIIASDNKNELVAGMRSANLIYHKEAEEMVISTAEKAKIESPKIEAGATDNGYGFNTKEYASCAINIDSVNWSQFKNLGITPEDLHRKGQLKKLLNGEKTDLLLVRTKNNEGVMMTGNFKFQLAMDDSSTPKLMVSGVRSKLNIPDNFHGYEFTEQEKQLLKEKGTLYKDVEIAGEKRLIYIDKQTNEICTRKTSTINVPDQVRGKTLSELEKDIIKSGKPILIKDFETKEGKKYNAWVFVNPEKNTIKLDFENPLKLKSQDNRKQNKLSV